MGEPFPVGLFRRFRHVVDHTLNQPEPFFHWERTDSFIDLL